VASDGGSIGLADDAAAPSRAAASGAADDWGQQVFFLVCKAGEREL
jgi:hypothetical protein